MSTEKKTWLGKIFETIFNFFHKADDIVDDILDWADTLVDLIKKAEESKVGQMLESGLELAFPASTGLINAFRLWLPKIAGAIANVQDFQDLSDEDKVKAFLAYLNKLKTEDPILYAGILNAVNAAIQQFFATNKGIVELTPQASLSIAQVNHDETLGGAIAA